MSVQETVQELQYAPLADRIWVIERLVQSLKEEVTHGESAQAQRKPFRVRTFDLGVDVHADRDEIYAERAV